MTSRTCASAWAIILLAALCAPATPAAADTFFGYDCTDDCSGHEAGYDWAESSGVGDSDDCTGNSESFIEGCRAWLQEQGHETDLDPEFDSEDAP
ncbi:MAG: hypothetical protein LBQ79_09935 [Deltaproteobacteria bacterium]|jgi:hypothetical protein|nr:hypothetical protein [Deltaproteobacteria bacterium]